MADKVSIELTQKELEFLCSAIICWQLNNERYTGPKRRQANSVRKKIQQYATENQQICFDTFWPKL